MHTIAYFVNKYLNFTETFIYEPLRNIKDFKVIVLCNEKRNLDQFPHKYIYSMSDLPQRERSMEKIMNFFGRSKYFNTILKENDIKLIHAHFAEEGISVLPLKRKLGLPMITSFYGIDIYMFNKNPIFMMRLRRLFREGDLFLTFSEKMRQHVISLGCPANKVLTHHGGADFSKFNFHERQAEKPVKILLVGRFVEKKGIEYAIKAMNIVIRQYPDAVLSIIGDGPLRPKLESLIKKLGLNGWVFLLGAKNHSEYIDELNRSHILIAPSVTTRSGDDEGGINTAVIEAMATGMPVIATINAGSELVFDGKTGYTVAEKDPEDLAKKLVTMLKNPGLWPALGKNCRKLIEEQFDIIKQTKKLEKLYTELINGKN